jgi:hypothetical protein
MYLKDAHQKEQDAYTREKDNRDFGLKDKQLAAQEAYYKAQTDNQLADLNMKGAQIQEQARLKSEEFAMEDCSRNPNSYKCLAARNSDPTAANRWIVNNANRVMPVLQGLFGTAGGSGGTPTPPVGGYSQPAATGLGALSAYEYRPLNTSLWGK